MLPVLLAAFVAACPVSPVEDFLRELISPMTGQHPAWLLETTSGRAFEVEVGDAKTQIVVAIK